MSFAPRSVRSKLLLVVLATTFTALLVTGISMLIYELSSYRQSLINDLVTQAEILGRASAPALQFEDKKTANENLSLLKARPNISGAAIYTAKGGLFASYAQSGTAVPDFPRLPEADGSQAGGNELVLFKRIVENNEILGTVYLKARYELLARLKDYLGILSAVMVVSLFVAGLMSAWLQTRVTNPILAIRDVARRVMEQRDFTLRASKTTDDEIGYLVDAFNDMLAEVGRRAAVLEASNSALEHEIAERRGAEEALRLNERRNRTLVAAITSVVWVADAKGFFREEQSSWAVYTGQQRRDYDGAGWRNAFQEDDHKTLDLAWARAMTNSEPFNLELRLWHEASERYRQVSMRAVPVVEPQGDVREWIGTISDIDDQRRAENDLHELNAGLEQRVMERTSQLEAANKELESFSYSVSHDLRAPVRAIAGFSKMLWDDHASQLDEEARRKLGIIQSEAHRMGVLIDELLTFSRLGRKAIQKMEQDMWALARSTFQRLQEQHDGPKPEFRLGSLPKGVGDRVLLEQVWANFLSNALKFSAKRENPVIEVGAISDEKEHVYFVRDNGIGFNPRHQSKLFGVFQRLHATGEFPGTGVGLALVQRIVVRHGGRVWADGKPGEGATFYFTLPKEQANGRV